MKQSVFLVVIALMSVCPFRSEAFPDLADFVDHIDASTIPGPDGVNLRVFRNRPIHPTAEVIFVPGSPGLALSFVPNFQKALPGVLTTTYDRPGFGDSGFIDGASTLEFQARSLAVLLMQNPQLPKYIVGPSYGGPLALLTAIENPTLARGLLLLAACVDPNTNQPVWYNYLDDDFAAAWMLPSIFVHYNDEMVDLVSSLQNLQNRWHELKTPLIAVQGSGDDEVDPENLDYIENQMHQLSRPGLLLEKTLKSGWSHYISYDHAKFVNQALLRMIRTSHPF